jgi:hypothetical protein
MKLSVDTTHLTKLIKRAIIFANIMFFQIFNGVWVVHAQEWLLWCFEILKQSEVQKNT